MEVSSENLLILKCSENNLHGEKVADDTEGELELFVQQKPQQLGVGSWGDPLG